MRIQFFYMELDDMSMFQNTNIMPYGFQINSDDVVIRSKGYPQLASHDNTLFLNGAQTYKQFNCLVDTRNKLLPKCIQLIKERD